VGSGGIPAPGLFFRSPRSSTRWPLPERRQARCAETRRLSIFARSVAASRPLWRANSFSAVRGRSRASARSQPAVQPPQPPFAVPFAAGPRPARAPRTPPPHRGEPVALDGGQLANSSMSERGPAKRPSTAIALREVVPGCPIAQRHEAARIDRTIDRTSQWFSRLRQELVIQAQILAQRN